MKKQNLQKLAKVITLGLVLGTALTTAQPVWADAVVNDSQVTVGTGQYELVYDSVNGSIKWGISTTTTSDEEAAATAFGCNTTASSYYATAFGNNTIASGENSTAFGSGTTASGEYATAFGLLTFAAGNGATAWGGYVDYANMKVFAGGYAKGDSSTAFGVGSIAGGQNSLAALGGVTGTWTERPVFDESSCMWTSLGTCTGGGANAVAIGVGAVATVDNSVAIGKYAKADTANSTSNNITTTQFAVGGGNDGANTYYARITGVADGVNDHDAATVGQISSAVNSLTYNGTSKKISYTTFGNSTAIELVDLSGLGGGGGEASLDYIAFSKDEDTFAAPTATGKNALAMGGGGAAASGMYSTAFGVNTKAGSLDGIIVGGTGATAFGYYTRAGAVKKGVMISLGTGYDFIADKDYTGDYATARGNRTLALGNYSTAFGESTRALGNNSTAFGETTYAVGDNSTAFGKSTYAIGNNSTAFGEGTYAIGNNSTAFGGGTIASGNYATAFGEFTKAGSLDDKTSGGAGATAWGYSTQAGAIELADTDVGKDGDYEGRGLTAGTYRGNYATAWGNETLAIGNYSTAFGSSTIASGVNATAWGGYYDIGSEDTVVGGSASGIASTAFGLKTTANGVAATAFGGGTIASGANATAFGDQSKAEGDGATAWGGYYDIGSEDTVVGGSAKGNASTAFGLETTANGVAATAFGYLTTADGDYATAFGGGTTASGMVATAFGYGSNAEGIGATAWGGYMDSDTYEAFLGAYAKGDGSTAFGAGSVAGGKNSLAALGGITGTWSTDATPVYVSGGMNAVAIGVGAIAKADNSVAIGYYAVANNAPSAPQQIGATNNYNVVTEFAVGGGSYAGTGEDAGKTYTVYARITGVADGTDAHDAVTLGQMQSYVAANAGGGEASLDYIAFSKDEDTFAAPTATGKNALAMGGGGAAASGDYATAFGENTTASGNYATAFGNYSNAAGSGATAWGGHYDEYDIPGSYAKGDSSTAFGVGSAAGGENSLAALGGVTGNWSYTPFCDTLGLGGVPGEWVDTYTGGGANAVAIGVGSNAKADNSVAIGQYAVTSFSAKKDTTKMTVVNDFAVGGGVDDYGYTYYSRITGVANGENDHDAVTYGQVKDVLANAMIATYDSSSNTLTLHKIADGSTTSGDISVTIGGSGSSGGDASLDYIAFNKDEATFVAPTATGDNALAMGGGGATASGDFSTAFGNGSKAGILRAEDNLDPDYYGYGATAWGYNTQAGAIDLTEADVSYSGDYGYRGLRVWDYGGIYATAWGNETLAIGDYSTAFGEETIASGRDATAFGGFTTAVGNNSTAFGYDTTAIGYSATAWGSGTYAGGFKEAADNILLDEGDIIYEGGNLIRLTAGDVAHGGLYYDYDNGRAITYAQALEWGIKVVDPDKGANATAFGSSTIASGESATAFGNATTASGDAATAFGNNTTASGDYATAFGVGTAASGEAATAFGYCTEASGTDATAFGYYTTAGGERSTAFGSFTYASGYNSVAFGEETVASGDVSTAFGVLSVAEGNGATAWGGHIVVDDQGDWTYYAGGYAKGISSTAYGEGSVAGGQNSFAALGGVTGTWTERPYFDNDYWGWVGTLSSEPGKTGANAVAIGVGAIAKADNSVAIGAYAQTGLGNKTPAKANEVINEFAVGGGTDENGNINYSQITGVADGVNDHDAVTVGQMNAALANVGGGASGEQLAAMNGRIDRLGTRIDKVGAGAAAMASMHPVIDEDSKLSFSAGLGAYRGEQAMALGAFYQPTDRMVVNLGGTVGNGDNMVGIGVNFALDRNVGTKLPSKAVMAKKIVAQDEEIADLKDKVAKLMMMVEKMKKR